MSLAPIVIHHVCPDADELREVARVWDLDFRPMARARGASELLQTVDTTALLGYAHISPRVEQRGASPAGMRTFALLGRCSPDVVWCGNPAGPDTLLSFDAGGDFEASSPSGFEVHTLSIDLGHLDGLASALGLGSVEEIGSEAHAIRLEPTRAEALRRNFERASSFIKLDISSCERPEVREVLEVDLPTSMLRVAIPVRGTSLPVAAPLRERALRRALEFIEANAARAPRISELRAASGASERTLRYAFQERFGMSPKAYLQAVRLNGVRRELRRRADGARITDAANRWGFWHIGQFAADYRRLFGRLPSETMGAQPGPAAP